MARNAHKPLSLAFLDPYIQSGSRVHALDPTFKLVYCFGVILIINLTPITSWPAHIAYLICILAIALLARIPIRRLIGRSMILAPFVLMASIGVPFVRQGEVVASVTMPWGTMVVTQVGLLRFANILAKSYLSILVTINLVFTTPFVEIAGALHAIGLPRLLVSVILMMYRYMFVLVEEALRMMRAREARSGQVEGTRSGGTLRWRAQVTGRMIGTLFLRTYERSERIYQAMLARGYTGKLRTLEHEHITWHTLAMGSLTLAVLAIVAIFTTARM